jgi:nucleotide-binding universal stress UspA family protein
VDPDRTGDPDLNRKILTLAASLAAHDSARLDVLHAWSFFAEDLLRNRGRLPEEEIAEILRGQEAAHRRQLQAAIEYAGLEPGSYALHLVHGTPHEEIVRHVRREGIQLLVIGTVRRARITGLLIGSTAETVLEQVDCSVLAVKPDAFIPPPLED